MLALALLVVHAGSAVADGYVDILWWQVVVPWRLSYEPAWLGLGTLACDLVLAVLVTSALRTRLGHREWGAVHLTTYLAWLAGVAHGIGIGTDTPSGAVRVMYVGCVSTVVFALGLRAATPTNRAARPGRGPRRVAER